MNAGDERGTAMKRPARLIACLAAAALAACCTVYKIKEMDGKALAAKGNKGRIVSVTTAEGPVNFSEKDPAEVKGGGVVGSLREICTVDPLDFAEIAPGKGGPNVVLRDGRRFRVAASKSVGESVECEAVKAVYVPLDEVVRAKVRTVNSAASILGTLAGVVLVAGMVALDVATYDAVDNWPGTDFTGGMIDSLIESCDSAPAGSGRRRSNKALLGAKDASNAAQDTEFWTMEWTAVDARPGEDGKLRLRLGNASGVPRGIDEAKLIVVDHPPGVMVAADVLGTVRACPGPVAPDSAAVGGQDIKELVSVRDGVLWRTAERDAASGQAAPARDEIALSFAKPKGARKAKLIVSASNSSWRVQFAREVPPALYQDWEFSKVRVRMLTVFGWQTVQVLFATGPLPASDLIYNLDLSDVGTDKVWLKLALPSGYWLIDRLALDFGGDLPVEAAVLPVEEVDGPDAAEVLQALAAEDSTTLRLGIEDPPALLTFAVPQPKEGSARSFFLRTVSCYEMPAQAKGGKNG
jgi:hypothetical protein